MTIERDRLFLLQPEFSDPAYGAAHALDSGQAYYCPYCMAVEGVLATNPQLADRLDVVRAPFQRPRSEVVALLGEDNQSLPKLVLAPDADPSLATGSHGATRFVSGHEAVMRVLALRHGVAYPHF